MDRSLRFISPLLVEPLRLEENPLRQKKTHPPKKMGTAAKEEPEEEDLGEVFEEDSAARMPRFKLAVFA